MSKLFSNLTIWTYPFIGDFVTEIKNSNLRIENHFCFSFQLGNVFPNQEFEIRSFLAWDFQRFAFKPKQRRKAWYRWNLACFLFSKYFKMKKIQIENKKEPERFFRMKRKILIRNSETFNALENELKQQKVFFISILSMLVFVMSRFKNTRRNSPKNQKLPKEKTNRIG